MGDAAGQRFENRFIGGIGTTDPPGARHRCIRCALHRLPFHGVTDVTMPVPRTALNHDRWNAPREPW